MDCVWLSVKDMKPSSRSKLACLRPYQILPQKRVHLPDACLNFKECPEAREELRTHQKYSENISKENKTKRIKIKLWGSGRKLLTKNEGKVIKQGCVAFKKCFPKELSSKDGEVKSQGSYFDVHKAIEVEKEVNFQGTILPGSEEVEMKIDDKFQESEDMLTKEFEVKKVIQTQEADDNQLKEIKMKGIHQESDENNSLENKMKDTDIEQDVIHLLNSNIGEKEEKLENIAEDVLKDKNECDKKQKESEDTMMTENYNEEIEVKPQESRESQFRKGHVIDQGKQLEVCEELIRSEVPKEWALPEPCIKHCDIAAEDNTIVHAYGHTRESYGTERHPTVVEYGQLVPVFSEGQVVETDVKFLCQENPSLSGQFSKKWKDEMGIICSDNSKGNTAADLGVGDDVESDSVKHQHKFSNFNPNIQERVIEHEVVVIKPTRKDSVNGETNIGSCLTVNNKDDGEFNERKEIITECTSTNIVVKSKCTTAVTFEDHKKFKRKQCHFNPHKIEVECCSLYKNNQVFLTELDVHLEKVELNENDTEMRVEKNVFVPHTDAIEGSSRNHSDEYMEYTGTPTIVKGKNNSLSDLREPKVLPQNENVNEQEIKYCMTNEESPSETSPGIFTEEKFHLNCSLSSLDIPRSCSQKNTDCCTVEREGDTGHLIGRRNVHSGPVPVKEGDPDHVPLEKQCDLSNIHKRDEGDFGHIVLNMECDQDKICLRKEYEYDHIPMKEKDDHDHIPIGREGKPCHVSVRDTNHLAVRREFKPGRSVVDPNDTSFRIDVGSDDALVSIEGDPDFVRVGRESELDCAPLRREGDPNHVLGGKKDCNSLCIVRDGVHEDPLVGESCDHENLPCIRDVNIHKTVVEGMHDNMLSCITNPSVCIIVEPTEERTKVVEDLDSQEKLYQYSSHGLETKDRDKLDESGEQTDAPLEGQENELIDEDFCRGNFGPERSFSCVVFTEREERQAADKDVINCYNSGHLFSLLRLSGALSNSNHLCSIPRSYLTVEIVMAAININIFKNSDIFTWICKICRPKSKKFTSKFDHQFQQYQQLYQHITEKVCPDKRDVWGNLLKQSVYRIPRGKGLCLIFGKIPELCKNEAVGVTHDGHLDGGIQKDMVLAPFKCQRGYDTCRESVKAMKGEIDRLLSELKCKNEELKHHQEYTKQEIKKIKEGDSGKQEFVNNYEVLIKEIESSWLFLRNQSATVNQDLVGEEKGAYLMQVPKVLTLLRQIVLEKESKMNQLQEKMNSYLDMVKAREIIIKQQQEEICKNEREATQTDAYIKQLKRKMKNVESRLKDQDSHIHQQDEQLKMKFARFNYVNQLEEDLTKLKGIVREQELLICQQQEKLTQMENAAIVCESLNNQLNQELKLFQHTLHERDTQIQCHQTLCTQLECDAQQKEAIAQRLKQELHACEATLSEKEACITKLQTERSIRITELEERLVCCNNLLVERHNIIEKLESDLAVSEKKGKEKETQIQKLEKEISHYQNFVMENQAVTFSDSSSVTGSFNNIQIKHFFKDTEHSHSYLNSRMAGNMIFSDIFYKPSLDHVVMLKKKEEELRRVTGKVKELEQILYSSKPERDGSRASDWKSVLELRTQISELKHCIVSREEMNGQLEEMLRNQEESIEKLRNHLDAKDAILNYLQMLCIDSNTALESFQEENLSLGYSKSGNRKTKWLGDLKVGCGFAIQGSSQEVSLHQIENMKLEPIHDSVWRGKECLGQTEEFEISRSGLSRQKPSIMHSCIMKEDTTITVGDVCNPNSILVQETSSSKRVVSKESHNLKITLSEYRIRSEGKKLDLEKEKTHLSSTSTRQKQNMKRKGNEVGLPDTSLLETMKNPRLEKRRRTLSRENFPTELNQKESTKSPIISSEDFSDTVKDFHAIPAIEQTGIRQEEYKYLKHRSKRCDYQAHQSLKEKNSSEEILRLKKTLEYVKGKHDRAMAKEMEERLKLEERSRSREILLAQLVKVNGKLEVQLRSSDTALTIIENDRVRIYTLLEQAETDLKQALDTEEHLKDLICQKDDASKLSHDEKAKLHLVIEQNNEEHQKQIEDLRHALIVKEINISDLKKEKEKLKEDITKERENHCQVTEQIEKNLSSKTIALEMIWNEKDQLIKDFEKKDIDMKIHMEEKQHLGTMLEIEKDRNYQFGKKLMEKEKKLRESIEEKIEVERLLKGKEQVLVGFEEKKKYMKATIEEKTKEMLQVQEEMCSLRIMREKEDAVKFFILLEKEKLQNTLQEHVQALKEQLEEKKQKEAIIQELQGTIILEKEKAQMIKKEADEALALKEQEIQVLQKDKEQLKVDIEENKLKHLSVLSEKDRYLKMQLELVSRDSKEVLQANTTLTSQLDDIKTTKFLIRKELKLGASSCKTLNLKQELESVRKLNYLLEEEKKRSGMMNRELLEQKSRNNILMKQLQMIKRDRTFAKRWASKGKKILLNQECQTLPSQEEDLQLHIETTKNLKTALETEKCISEGMYLKLLVEQKKSLSLATGLQQVYEETSKDLEYQLSLFCWSAEKYREKLRKLEELTAISTNSELGVVEEFSP